tara:strand:+ start:1618 stop:2157 length:540 start_codon:yes stop_codon:yes gene_type:complete
MKTHHYIKLLKHLKVDPKKIPLCIETGTHRGWGTEQWSKFFEKVITIELSEELFKFCLDTYGLSNVEFLQGSSDKVLKDLIENITQPYFLFLDAHGSGGDTTYDKSVGRFGSPVIEEIKAIKNNLPQFIVIDDWNLFTELPSYPDPDIVKEEVSKVGDYSFSTYSCDIITGGVLVCERN